MARAGTPVRALMFLQAYLVQEFRRAVRVDPLVGEAVKALMPWHPVDIDTLATHLALSASQLRRRCLQEVGVSPSDRPSVSAEQPSSPSRGDRGRRRAGTLATA